MNVSILDFIDDLIKNAKQSVVKGISQITITPAIIYEERTIPAEVKVEISNWKTWENLLFPLLEDGAVLKIENSDFDCDTGEITKSATGSYKGVSFCLSTDMDQSEQDEYDKKILGENDEG